MSEPTPDEMAQLEQTAKIVVVISDDGTVTTSTENITVLAAPTLLRIAALQVEKQVGL